VGATGGKHRLLILDRLGAIEERSRKVIQDVTLLFRGATALWFWRV